MPGELRWPEQTHTLALAATIGEHSCLVQATRNRKEHDPDSFDESEATEAAESDARPIYVIALIFIAFIALYSSMLGWLSGAGSTSNWLRYLAPLIALIALSLATIPWIIDWFNELIRYRVACDHAWAQCDALLKRRHDLIPNLVEIVKGYAAHESSTLGSSGPRKITSCRSSGEARC